jgi:predicted nucleic acid-binding protein
VAFAYVDTSCLVAIAFGEKGATALARSLDGFDELFASNLLEAELRATFKREGVIVDQDILSAVSWVVPDRPLSREISTVLEAGPVRGADCWHLATALFLAEDPSEIAFLTLDSRQKAVAKALGFRT